MGCAGSCRDTSRVAPSNKPKELNVHRCFLNGSTGLSGVSPVQKKTYPRPASLRDNGITVSEGPDAQAVRSGSRGIWDDGDHAFRADHPEASGGKELTILFHDDAAQDDRNRCRGRFTPPDKEYGMPRRTARTPSISRRQSRAWKRSFASPHCQSATLRPQRPRHRFPA